MPYVSPTVISGRLKTACCHDCDGVKDTSVRPEASRRETACPPCAPSTDAASTAWLSLSGTCAI